MLAPMDRTHEPLVADEVEALIARKAAAIAASASPILSPMRGPAGRSRAKPLRISRPKPPGSGSNDLDVHRLC